MRAGSPGSDLPAAILPDDAPDATDSVDLALTAEAEVERVLEQRARLAARRPPTADDTARLSVLAFHMGQSAFAVETRHVLEVCAPAGMTDIPCAPGFIGGVIALRGRILAIVDLAALFGLAAEAPTPEERVVVLRGGGMEFGLRVHAVDGVMQVPVPEPDTSLPAFTGHYERFFLGISGQELAVLDGERLLADDALKVSGRTARQLPAPPEEG